MLESSILILVLVLFPVIMSIMEKSSIKDDMDIDHDDKIGSRLLKQENFKSHFDMWNKYTCANTTRSWMSLFESDGSLGIQHDDELNTLFPAKMYSKVDQLNNKKILIVSMLYAFLT